MKKLFKLIKSWCISLLFLIWTRTNRAPRSKGERDVIDYLNKHHIKYKRELRLRCDQDFQRNVYVDFYLPSMNTYIEYNGRQHYGPVEYFGSKAQFERQQKRDQWLRDYCAKKGIRLIEIPYYADVAAYLCEVL